MSLWCQRRIITTLHDFMKNQYSFLEKYYNISPFFISKAKEAEELITCILPPILERGAYNQLKVLKAFHEEGVQESDLAGTTGYGYNDSGREKLDRIWARIFGAETALVRCQFVSGTQAIAAAIMANCSSGDLVTVLGTPYDTLRSVFGTTKDDGALGKLGVKVHYIPFNGEKDIASLIPSNTKWLFLQRSRGYSEQPPLAISDIEAIIKAARSLNPSLLVMVDNCYGEFVENCEPLEVGVDLIAGSLIKNPGGGLAPTGGYVAGTKAFVNKAAERLTAPGLGRDVGATLGLTRPILQGLFLAPLLVSEALKGMVFASAFWNKLGYNVFPGYDKMRTDIIQGIALGSKEQVLAFCHGIQKAGPVDSMVRPEGWAMPGYEEEVVMAGGTFIQGGSLELSCDAPLRTPYIVYLQGGLSATQVRLGCLLAAMELEKKEKLL